MGLLAGKICVITGAGAGIGKAYALRFAAEGAKVVVNDLNEQAADATVLEIKREGGVALANADSIATAKGAESLMTATDAAFGHADILINNAGFLRDKSILKMDEAMWDDVIAVHLKGAFVCAQAFAKRAVARKQSARIINTTSISGMLGNFGQANYSAAKAGVYGLTRTLSIELQKHQIYVNAIAPIAKTQMTEHLPMFDQVTTLGPEHIAPAAVFLASDLAGTKTGYVLGVAGARVYAFKVVETAGRFKEGDALWTPEEIAENWDSIVRA